MIEPSFLWDQHIYDGATQNGLAVLERSRHQFSRIETVVTASSLFYAAMFLTVLGLHPGSKHAYEAFNNGYQILAPLFAGLCSVFYAVRSCRFSRTNRAGWLLIGLAGLSFAGGQACWTYYESIRGVEVPSPGWCDVGYLGAYPLLIAGVLMLFGSVRAAGRTRQLLDGAIAASSVGILSWYFIVEQVWRSSSAPLLGKIVSVAYPLGDIASLFCVMVLLSSGQVNWVLRRSYVCLAVGLAGFIFFDTTYTFLSLKGTYHTGSWFDWTLSFGWLLIGWAPLLVWFRGKDAAAPLEQKKVAASAFAGMLKIFIPYAAVIVAFGLVLAHDYRNDHKIEQSTLVAGYGLVLMVILRQVFTLVENLSLTAALRGFNENLESLIGQRTEQLQARTEQLDTQKQQLSSLLQLTKAANTTLDVDQVLSATSEHARKAMRADGIILQVVDGDMAASDQFPRIYRHEGIEGQHDLLAFIQGLPVCHQVEMLSLPQPLSIKTAPRHIYLRAPLMCQQQVIGAIGIIRWESNFEASDAELLESIGIEAGTAIRNARVYSEAREAADRDSVTGLYNHRAMHQRIEKALNSAHSQAGPLALVMMDVNNFKLFNDTYGHPVGDQVLKKVAQVLTEECDKQALVGRYGGDEFIVALPGLDAQAAVAAADRLRERMEREGFQRAGEERTVPISLSFGIATYPADGTNRHELLTIADGNLYQAKGSNIGIVTTTDNQRVNRHLRAEGSFGILDAMVAAVDNKDRYTRQHSEDVTEYSLWIAEELGLSDETMRDIRVSGLLHDVGKIGVPDDILRKPGRLTADEYEIMKRHPQLGAFIVGAMPGMEAVVDAVRFHHERWDGQGYPCALAGEEIPLVGRIMAVADAFSAMTTHRPYRKGLDWDSALAQVHANLGTQFDPEIARAFLRTARSRHEQFESRRGQSQAGPTGTPIAELPKAA